MVVSWTSRVVIKYHIHSNRDIQSKWWIFQPAMLVFREGTKLFLFPVARFTPQPVSHTEDVVGSASVGAAARDLLQEPTWHGKA